MVKGRIDLGIGLIELGIGLIELVIGLIELGIGLIELGIGLIELGIGLIELGIGRHTDCGEAGSATSRKQGGRVGWIYTMTIEKKSKNDILF